MPQSCPKLCYHFHLLFLIFGLPAHCLHLVSSSVTKAAMTVICAIRKTIMYISEASAVLQLRVFEKALLAPCINNIIDKEINTEQSPKQMIREPVSNATDAE